MILDFKMKITHNDIEIKIPEINTQLIVPGVIILTASDNEGINNSIFEIDKTEEEFKQQALEQYMEMSDDEYYELVRQGNKPKDKSFEEMKEFRKVCKKDYQEKTFDFWIIEREYFDFIYPFSKENFNPNMIISYLKFYVTKITFDKLMTRALDRVLWNFFNRYKFNYKLDIEHYEEIKEELRNNLEKELKRNKRFIAANEIWINNKKLKDSLF